MKGLTKAIYNMSAVLLYSVANFAWNLYLRYVKNFTVFNAMYTQQWGEDQLAAVAAAMAIPDSDQRGGTQRGAGKKLDTAAKKSVAIWKKLKRYIMNAYPAAEWDMVLKQAGIAHYTKAAALMYGEVAVLLSDGFSFLITNADTLQSAGMPEEFMKEFAEAKKMFETMQAFYSNAKGTSAGGTIDKVTANNTVFTNLKTMLNDALAIFEEQRDIQKQFTIAAIMRLITTDGVSGIHFVVRDSQTKKPLDTATISIVGQKQPFSVNKRGVLDIKLPKATYYYSATVPGYPVFEGLVVLDANVMRRTEILVKQANAAAIAS